MLYSCMKTYKAVFKEGETEGVFGISLVENPAMEGQFIALSKEKVQFKEVDGEKRILTGLVLEPNKPIYRNNNGNEYYIEFDEDTIRDLSYNFFRSSSHKNSTIEHESPIEGITFVESWIVDDPKNDKGNAIGLSYPKGSWLATMKVDSDEIWQNYVKSGKVLGFSIDAIIKLEEMSETKLSKVDVFLSSLKDVLGLSEEKPKEVEEVKMGSAKSKDGKVTIQWDGDTIETGAAVYVATEEGERVPLPVGDYELEDGNVISVQEEGIIGEAKPMEAPKEEEMEQDAPAPEAPTAEPTIDNEMQDLVNAINKITIQYSEQKVNEVKKENEEIVSLKKELEDLKVEFAKLKEEPAATPKKTQATQVNLSKPATTKKGRIYNSLKQ